MFRSPYAAMTPDKTVKWRRQNVPGGKLYVAPDAAADTRSLLLGPAGACGEPIGSGRFGTAYLVGDASQRVVKEVLLDAALAAAWLNRMCGMIALRLNIGLEAGLPRLGDRAVLPTGRKLVTPHYYGALLGDGVVRALMSFEPGDPVYQGDPRAGTHAERVAIFDAALAAVGAAPLEHGHYDDIPTDKETNLFARTAADGTEEIVMLDAAELI
jgi:hypothetical protein